MFNLLINMQELLVLLSAAICGYIVILMMIWKFIWFGPKYFKARTRLNQPACMTDPKLGRHLVVSLRKAKLHCVENTNKESSEQLPLLLLLHGFPEFWFSWRHQLKEFKNEYKVVAVDLRGFGFSEKPEIQKAYSRELIVEDIKELIDVLGHDSKKTVLVGHDWGGAIACSVASRYPNLVDRLVLVNTPHPRALEEALVGFNWLQWLRSWHLIFFLLPYLPEWVLRMDDVGVLDDLFQTVSEVCSEQELEAYKYIYSQPGAFTPPLNYYRMAFWDYFKDLKSGATRSMDYVGDTVPTLMIWGEKDYIYQAETAKQSRRFIEKLKIEFVPNIGHWIHMESPTKFNAILKDFLNDS